MSMVSIDDVRSVASTLPRTTEALVRGRVKFRVGSIVYLAFSRDAAVMGCAFPKEWRAIVVAAEPRKFRLPDQTDLRYNWVLVQLAALDWQEMLDLVFDAWSMAVPKHLADEQAPRFARGVERDPSVPT